MSSVNKLLMAIIAKTVVQREGSTVLMDPTECKVDRV